MTEDGTKIPCLFNPAELHLNQTNGWAADAMPGSGVGTLRYLGAQSGTVSLSLFFDTTDTGLPVTDYTKKIVGLMEVDSSLPGSSPRTNNARPPWVQFHWGDFRTFKAVVSHLSLSFEYFSPTGIPLRARATMGLVQYEQDHTFGPQNPTSGTPRPHRVHQVRPGETLDRIAALHLGKSTAWRLIAEENGIEDPLDLRPGRLLSIPGMF